MSLREYVDARGYGEDMFNFYIVPMSSAVWSTPPEKMAAVSGNDAAALLAQSRIPRARYAASMVDGVRRCEELRAEDHRAIPRSHPAQWPQSDARGATDEGARSVHDGSGEAQNSTKSSSPAMATSRCGCWPIPQPLKASCSERSIISRTSDAAHGRELHAEDTALLGVVELPHPSAGRTETYRRSTHYWMNRLQGVSDREDYFV